MNTEITLLIVLIVSYLIEESHTTVLFVTKSLAVVPKERCLRVDVPLLRISKFHY